MVPYSTRTHDLDRESGGWIYILDFLIAMRFDRKFTEARIYLIKIFGTKKYGKSGKITHTTVNEGKSKGEFQGIYGVYTSG